MRKKRSRAGRAAAVIIVVLLLAAVGVLAYYSYSMSKFEKYYQQSVERWSSSYGVDEYLVYAMIYSESGGREKAVSHAGAVGAMQLMPNTASWIAQRESLEYSDEMLMRADYNIRLGCAYIKYLQGRFQNNDCVIAAYNAGPNIVAKWLEDGRYSNDGVSLKDVPYGETRQHIKRVNSAVKVYEKLYPRDHGEALKWPENA